MCSLITFVCLYSQWLPDLGDDRGFDGPDLAPPRWSRLPGLLPWCPLLWQRREGLQVGGDVGLILRDAACPGETKINKARMKVRMEEENSKHVWMYRRRII